MRNGTLDLARLGLASLVIFSHAFGLLGMEDPLRQAGAAINLGHVAVCGFFILSGYLVSTAWLRKPGLDYFRNRFLRIVPGYAVAFVISVIVVGALAAPNASVYLAAIRWDAEAQMLLTLHSPTYLPVAFTDQPMPYLNGPIWTIKWEALCYLLAPALVFRRVGLYALFALTLALAVLIPMAGEGPTAFPRFLALFTFGAIIADLGWKPPRVPYCLPDVSYGTYLYGWPIAQLLVKAGVTQPLALFAFSLPLAWLAGLASWTCIERWALSLKRRERSVGPSSLVPAATDG